MIDPRVRQLVEELHAIVTAPDVPDIVVTAPPAIVLPTPANDLTAADGFEDYGAFYDFLRGNDLLGPKISQSEYNGCDAILTACVRARWGVSYTAYAMATAYLETAHTMLPIKELGGTAYFTRMYDINGQRPKKARELGNLTPGDGALYPGMGYVQLTGKRNYAVLTKRLRELGLITADIDLVKMPALAMRPDIAAAVMIVGMEEGLFTTRKLSDDLPASGPATVTQFVRSRDIINGTDRQQDVADYAVTFQTGMMQAGYRIAA